MAIWNFSAASIIRSRFAGFALSWAKLNPCCGNIRACGESVVVVREDRPGDKRLAAYVVRKPESQVDADELRRFARESLPEYMVPAAFVFLDALPLTPNGKVDRKALPAPEQERRPDTKEFAEPGSGWRRSWRRFGAKCSGIERISATDNFFELGGHSLLAIQVISRVREKLKVELPLFSLFDAPTIQQLARGLDSGEWTQNHLPLMPMQSAPRDWPPAVVVRAGASVVPRPGHARKPRLQCAGRFAIERRARCRSLCNAR